MEIKRGVPESEVRGLRRTRAWCGEGGCSGIGVDAVSALGDAVANCRDAAGRVWVAFLADEETREYEGARKPRERVLEGVAQYVRYDRDAWGHRVREALVDLEAVRSIVRRHGVQRFDGDAISEAASAGKGRR